MDTQRWFFKLWLFDQNRPSWLVRLYAVLIVSFCVLGVVFTGHLVGQTAKALLPHSAATRTSGVTVKNLDNICAIYIKAVGQPDWGDNLLLGNTGSQLNVPLPAAHYIARIEHCDGTVTPMNIQLEQGQLWVLP